MKELFTPVDRDKMIHETTNNLLLAGQLTARKFAEEMKRLTSKDDRTLWREFMSSERAYYRYLEMMMDEDNTSKREAVFVLPVIIRR